MDLLIATDVFQHYIRQIGTHPKSELDRDIDSLLRNPNCRFLLSRSLVESIEKAFVGNSQAESFMQPFLTHLIENQSLNISSTVKEGTDLEIATSMSSNYISKPNNIKRGVYLDIALSEVNSLKMSTSVIIERIVKPNFHWLWFSIACHNPKPICLRYFDFKSDKEIEEIFKYAIDTVQLKPFADIFDRQVNLSHSLFNSLNGMFVNYYTSIKLSEQKNKKDEIKKSFKKGNVYTSSPNNVHERRIMIDCLIIEADDDFWNLTHDRSTWKIDITYCANTCSAISQKKSSFKLIM